MDKKSRQVIRELFIGIGMHTAFFAVLGIPLMRPYFLFLLGLLTGGAVSCICILLLYEDLDRALDLDSEHARRFVMLRGILRLAARIALLAGAMVLSMSCFYGAVIGMLSTKVAGYLHPVISKHITKTYVPASVENETNDLKRPEEASSAELDDEPDFDDIEGRMERK